MAALSLERDGAVLLRGLASGMLGAALGEESGPKAGRRVTHNPELAALLSNGSVIGAALTGLAGHSVQPVRALLFDKQGGANWALD